MRTKYLKAWLSALALVLPNMAWASNGDGAATVFGLLVVLLVLALGVLLYFLPAIIGSKRQVNSSGWLFVINLLLGWTGLGWIVCLLWAVCGQTKAQDAYWRQQVGHG
jgi:hypothetical protein